MGLQLRELQIPHEVPKEEKRKKHSRAPSTMSGVAEEKRKSGPAVKGELEIAHEGPKVKLKRREREVIQETTMVLENYRTITEGPKEGKRKRKHSRATNTISGVEAEKRKH